MSTAYKNISTGPDVSFITPSTSLLKSELFAQSIWCKDSKETYYKVCINNIANLMLNNGTSWNLHVLLQVVHGSVQQADPDQLFRDYTLFRYQTLASERFIN